MYMYLYMYMYMNVYVYLTVHNNNQVPDRRETYPNRSMVKAKASRSEGYEFNSRCDHGSFSGVFSR